MRYEVERDLIDVEFHILSGLSSEASDCDKSGLEKGETQPCSNVSHRSSKISSLLVAY